MQRLAQDQSLIMAAAALRPVFPSSVRGLTRGAPPARYKYKDQGETDLCVLRGLNNASACEFTTEKKLLAFIPENERASYGVKGGFPDSVIEVCLPGTTIIHDVKDLDVTQITHGALICFNDPGHAIAVATVEPGRVWRIIDSAGIEKDFCTLDECRLQELLSRVMAGTAGTKGTFDGLH
eukprot:COSAG06_NODE_16994_length_968_cov_0.985040_1_plen_179_part_10